MFNRTLGTILDRRVIDVVNALPDRQAWWPEAAHKWAESDVHLLRRLDPDRLPAHVAVIMDGNGRWARQRGFLDRIRGHEAGIEAVRETTRTAAELGLQVLTLYAFSKENWTRPGREVKALMGLLTHFLVAERDELMENNIRLRMIGREEDLPAKARDKLFESMDLTSGNSGMVLNLALSYSSRDELTRVTRDIARLVQSGEIELSEIDRDTIDGLLDTSGLPEPDLLIRTSGEMRISNFLLWQIAYAEIHVTPVLWPDFRRAQFLEALIDYQGRDRRFGGI
jgi:undecaprenyl diphosphate synthase